MRIRQARADDAGRLSELALRSKAHWGYDAEFLEACRAELTVTAKQCAAGEVSVAEGDGGEFAGFSRVVSDASGSGRAAGLGRASDAGTGAGAEVEGVLEALFVDPAFIGQGVGGRLLRHALARAAAMGLTSLVLDADPFAVPFYEHCGASIIGTAPSGSIAGRELPRMRIGTAASFDAREG
ncbi:GNAT family N-acetyltransferase [Leifsonia bigeumensis]|uniref:GNAT family N-acetyltransferase n=1 Tax=Leifsonella bigeumensis TaxID=433643 RepID=A0ABP7FIK8_9MICO